MPELVELGRWLAFLDRESTRMERALDAALPAADAEPKRLHRAMRYMIFPGGKRIRPALAVLGFRASGGRGSAGHRVGAAIEILHTFSLIHDDLPCMDDDDFRRGRLSCHRKFGEAIAVLAGDALQVVAFEHLATLPVAPDRRLRALAAVTRAVGTLGVLGGQVSDLESEGRRISESALRSMHSRKTAALITAALVGGAEAGGGDPSLIRALTAFGSRFGLLFQIVDDVLNEVGTYEVLGRKRGGDRAKAKATYPSILGEKRTRERMHASAVAAVRAVPRGVRDADLYRGVIVHVLSRLPASWSAPAIAELRLEGGRR